MLTLLEQAKQVQNPLARGVVEIFSRRSPVLERLPFVNIQGNAYKYNREESLGDVAFRGINESYTESTGLVNPQTENLYVFGGIAKVDRALVQTQGNLVDLKAQESERKSRAIALDYTKYFFKGDNTSNNKQFDGLENRLTGNQVLDMGSTSGGDTLTLAKIDELIDAVDGGPDVLFMNKTLRRKVNTLMRGESQAIETVRDGFGRQLTTYGGYPIAVIEKDSDNAEILQFNEDNPGGGTAASSSIYAVKFGAGEYVSGIQNGGVQVIDLGLDEVYHKILIEWICGLGVFHPQAAARLRGIKNA